MKTSQADIKFMSCYILYNLHVKYKYLCNIYTFICYDAAYFSYLYYKLSAQFFLFLNSYLLGQKWQLKEMIDG